MKTLIIILFSTISLICNSQKQYDLLKIDNHMFLTLTLNGKPAMFIIDSGSSKSLLDVSKAKKFNFNFIEFGSEKYAGIGGLSQIYMVYDYKIDEISTSLLGVNIAKIGSLFNTNGSEIVGILGADFLSDNEVILNFKNNTLTMK
jgi:hypothetical protein